MSYSRNFLSRYVAQRFARRSLGSKSNSGTVVRLVGMALILSLGWALLTELDVVVAGAGVVQAEDQVKVVRTLDAGVVRTIFVAEGHEVSVGQPLLALDPAAANSQLQELEVERQRLSSKAHLARGLLETSEATTQETPTEGLLAMTAADRVTLQHELTVWQRREQHQRSVDAVARATVDTAAHALQAADEALGFQTLRRDDVLKLVEQDFMTRHALQNVEQEVLRARAAHSLTPAAG